MYSYKRRRLDGSTPEFASSATIFPSNALCMRAIAARICVASPPILFPSPSPGASAPAARPAPRWPRRERAPRSAGSLGPSARPVRQRDGELEDEVRAPFDGDVLEGRVLVQRLRNLRSAACAP